MENITSDTQGVEVSKSYQKNNRKKLIVIGSFVFLLVLGVIGYLFVGKKAQFCFDFREGMQFGDKKEQVSPNTFRGVSYFIAEVSGLQGALLEEGFYIDPFEQDGGKVYLGPFFGPTTKTALIQFQKKHTLSETGYVDPATLALLSRLYACPTMPTSTATTTIQK